MLMETILNKKAKIGVIGLGYTGLPLAVAFSQAGFKTAGIDIDKERIKKLNSKVSYIPYVDGKNLKNENLSFSMDYKILTELDVIILCVPTPLSKNKEPDLGYVTSATLKVAKNMHNNQLIILESTTYPGTTRDVILPLLQKDGFKVGKNFYLAYSPERIDPNNEKFHLKNTPKLVSGITHRCADLARELYSQICNDVIVTSAPEVAEMAKIFENIFRNVNIALVNELAMFCDVMKIDVIDVIAAASTKPFGYMPFFPGPGVGGHCIPVDPFYLSWKAKEYGFPLHFIELSGEINEKMPYYIVSKIGKALNNVGKSIKKSRILILGVTYKKDSNDLRNSPALRIIRCLKEDGAVVYFNDPYVNSLDIDGNIINSKKLSLNLLKSVDCVVIHTNHTPYDYKWIEENSKVLVDTRWGVSKIKKA